MDENVSDALKMAAAILIFVSALTITIMSFSKARKAATSVMKKLSSLQTYYDINNIYLGEDKYNVTSYRKVGSEIVIPTMYSYYKQGYTIVFYTGNIDNNNNIVADSIKPLTLYYTEALNNQLQKSSLAIIDSNTNTNTKAIYGIDVNDEITRQEPWSNNESYTKKFLDALINAYGNGTTIANPSEDPNPRYYTSRNKNTNNTSNYFGSDYNGPYYELKYVYTDETKGEENLIKNSGKFIERIGEYSYSKVGMTEDQTNESGTYITFNNNQTIANPAGTTKRVIQYIYIK